MELEIGGETLLVNRGKMTGSSIILFLFFFYILAENDTMILYVL